jgi:hypothetical protein
MAGIYIGSTPINPSLGGTALSGVYVGATKVWPTVPARTYEEFLAHIATLGGQRVSSSNQIFTSNGPLQLYNILKNSGSMQGSPFNANGRVRRVDSNHTYRRPIQHAVHSEAVFNAIADNGRELYWNQTGGDLTGPYAARTRNGYTSSSYSFQWGGAQLSRILYWDDIEGHAWEGLKTFNVEGIVYTPYDW